MEQQVKFDSEQEELLFEKVTFTPTAVNANLCFGKPGNDGGLVVCSGRGICTVVAGGVQAPPAIVVTFDHATNPGVPPLVNLTVYLNQNAINWLQANNQDAYNYLNTAQVYVPDPGALPYTIASSANIIQGLFPGTPYVSATVPMSGGWPISKTVYPSGAICTATISVSNVTLNTQ